MSNIKKVYQPLMELLKSNPNKTIKSLLPKILEIVESKQQSKCFLSDKDGNVTHIFCYYHKKWEEVNLYGKKKHSTSGFNSMCKVGVNQWTKQQRLYKLGKVSLLDELLDGTLSSDDAQKEKEKLEELKILIEPREDGHGFTNEEDIGRLKTKKELISEPIDLTVIK